jgi:hypothetical protein
VLARIRHGIDRVGLRRFFAALAALIAVLSGLVTIIAFFRPASNNPAPSNSVPSTAVPVGVATSGLPLTVAAVPPSGTISIGSCLAYGHAVSCDAPHQSEVYSVNSACNMKDLVGYLGGTPDTDVLRSTIAPITVKLQGQTVCIVSIPSGAQTSGSVKQVLDTPGGDVWRRCLDNRYGREVPCSDPHTDEFVFSGLLSPSESLDCTDRASRYLMATVAGLSTQLTVRDARQGTTLQCLVEVLGENVLNSSVRRIGTNALPITPD